MSDHKKIAMDAAKEAGSLLLELSKQDIKYEKKNAHDILAEGDLKSEKIIIDKIKANFPDHAIFSEEAGKSTDSSEYLWIIDPVDGTINFARHIEEYCISIALSRNGELILGVIYQPALDKMFVAERGAGAYLNDKKLAVSTETELVDSLVATDLTSNMEKRKLTFDIMAQLSAQVRHVRIFGSCALHLARVAEGQLDFYYKTRLNYWDYAAGIVLVEEAGGKITDFAGNPIREDSADIAVSNTLLHDVGLSAIRR
jgi:myo-inositol-1(or 4)-monophosphatase